MGKFVRQPTSGDYDARKKSPPPVETNAEIKNEQWQIINDAPQAGGWFVKLKVADKSGARFALIVGESELAAGKAALKPLRDGKPKRLVTVEECVDALRQTPASA